MRGRPSFRSRPQASGRLGPMPLRGGPGRHRALARPPVLPNALSVFWFVKPFLRLQSLLRRLLLKTRNQQYKFLVLSISVRGCAQRMDESCCYWYPAAPRRGCALLCRAVARYDSTCRARGILPPPEEFFSIELYCAGIFWRLNRIKCIFSSCKSRSKHPHRF
jgi:hypothetical protein